jgi:hypothetical protein
MHDDLEEMDPAQARHLREIADSWATYGPALKVWSALDGGMTWKSVHGAEYLCRYRQDPKTGKKRFSSLGRRSAETEKTYTDFIERRGSAKSTVLVNRDRMTTAGRVAKAYGLARMPVAAADILRALWLRSLGEEVAVFGGTALFAYELQTKILAPAALERDERLILFRRRPDLPVDDIVGAYEAAVDAPARLVKTKDRIVIRAAAAVPVELWDRDAVLGQLDDPDRIEVLEEGIAADCLTGLTVARDGQPVEFRTFDLRTYALMASVLGHDDDVWSRRARFAATLVCGHWPEPFDPRQTAAFPDLCADPEDRQRYRGP